MKQFYTCALMSVLPLVAMAEEPMRADARCGQVLVSCTINERPMLLMLDTGASHTVLHIGAEKRLPKLKKLPKEMVNVSGNATTPPDVALVALTVGDKSTPEHPVLMVNLQQLHTMMKEKVDGILGMDVLRHLDYTLDFANGKFRWGLPEDADNLQEIPGAYNQVGCFETPLLLNEKPHVFLLDSGCSRSVMKPEDWPYEKEMEYAVQVADINTARDQEMADGKPTDVTWAGDVTLKAFSPMLIKTCPRSLLGVDALRNVVLVHKAATQEKPYGQFLVKEAQEAPSK